MTSFQRAIAQAEVNKARTRAARNYWWRDGSLWAMQGHSASQTESDAIECILDECVAHELSQLPPANIIHCEFRSPQQILLDIPLVWDDISQSYQPDVINWAKRTFLPEFLPRENLEDAWHQKIAARRNGQRRRNQNKQRGKRWGKQWRRDDAGALQLVSS